VPKTARRVPDRGDIVWLDFTPQSGHEQAGRRPALVVSPAAYNGKVGLALVCPITNQSKGYPFEVEIPKGGKTTGVILADQVKSLDWRARNADVFAHVPSEVVGRVQRLLRTLLWI
jgi:mRNA interferase MazF